VSELNSTRLADSVRIVPIYDRADLVHNTLHTVSHTLLEGLVIVVAVLFLFLGSVRAALLAAITIPPSLLFAFVCMHFAGIPANLLSLGALDFGIIVDGTLIMVEHIVSSLAERRHAPNLAGETDNERSSGVLQTILDAALQVERPIFFSLIIIIAAYIPLFTLEPVERRLFTPMAYTVCFALLGSMLLALTLIPVLATYLFGRGAKTWDNPVLSWLQRGYGWTLARVVQRPWMVVVGSVTIVVAALSLGTQLGSEFLPQLDEGVIWFVRIWRRESRWRNRLRWPARSASFLDPSAKCSWSARKPDGTIQAPILTVRTAMSCSWRSSRTIPGRPAGANLSWWKPLPNACRPKSRERFSVSVSDHRRKRGRRF